MCIHVTIGVPRPQSKFLSPFIGHWPTYSRPKQPQHGDMGKPIVATSIEGYAGVMTSSKEGLLVPPKDSQELSQALLALITDKSIRKKMGSRGLITAQEHDWKSIAQRVFDYYTEVLNQVSQQKPYPKFEAISASV